MTHNPEEEIMVLSHKPWPGYKKAFLVAFILGCIYLGVILFSSVPQLPVHG